MKIEKGKVYECIKDVNHCNNHQFIKGKCYVSPSKDHLESQFRRKFVVSGKTAAIDYSCCFKLSERFN